MLKRLNVFARAFAARIHNSGVFAKEEKESFGVDACSTAVDGECLCYDEDSWYPSEWPKPKVVIVGAGMAGLTAANRLISCGLTNVNVVEAMASPGGRCKTCSFGDTLVDLGADRLYGACVANKAFNMAVRLGILSHPLKRINYSDHGVFLTSDGRAIDDEIASKAVEKFTIIEHNAAVGAVPDNVSLEEYIVDNIEKSLLEFFDVQKYDAFRVLYALIGGLRSRIGSNLNEFGAGQYSVETRLPGGDVRLPGGMSRLTSAMAGQLPQGVLMTGKPVTNIRWGAATLDCPRAIVKCKGGSEIPADFVIVTLPLGVLKDMNETLFCPSLPSSKTEGINRLGIGNICKVFLLYDHPFWAQTTANYRLAWCPEELQEIDDWRHSISEIVEVEGSKKVLLATVAGRSAEALEHMPDSKIAEELTEALRKFTGDRSIPYPTSVLRSDWSTNPFFFGAKTYLGPNSGQHHITNLARPLPDSDGCIPPIILFAGEHTSADFFGTVHGARNSGLREADRVVKLAREVCVLRAKIKSAHN